MNKHHKTFMWQELHGEQEFRFQTTDPKLHKRMHRSRYFKLVVIGMNIDLWVYQASFYSPKEARRSLERMSGSIYTHTADTGVFCVETGATTVNKIDH
jgi:hypothetical protein